MAPPKAFQVGDMPHRHTPKPTLNKFTAAKERPRQSCSWSEPWQPCSHGGCSVSHKMGCISKICIPGKAGKNPGDVPAGAEGFRALGWVNEPSSSSHWSQFVPTKGKGPSSCHPARALCLVLGTLSVPSPGAGLQGHLLSRDLPNRAAPTHPQTLLR